MIIRIQSRGGWWPPIYYDKQLVSLVNGVKRRRGGREEEFSGGVFWVIWMNFVNTISNVGLRF